MEQLQRDVSAIRTTVAIIAGLVAMLVLVLAWGGAVGWFS